LELASQHALRSSASMSLSVVALALVESTQAFQAPALHASRSLTSAKMFAEGDVGVLPPLGVYDPLGLIENRDMRRYEIMEIKHGRAAMLGFLHVLVIEAGLKFPTEQCAAAPTGLIASLESMTTFEWLQIMLTSCMMETGYFLYEPQTDDKAPGDIGGDLWVRYEDAETKSFKLNVERQNGRAAMLGITGCLAHELAGVDALFPTGGIEGNPPPPIF